MRLDDLLGKALDLLTGQERNRDQGGRVRPASEDPYGDPADQGYRPAGPYPQRGEVRPASEDPYGDPADQERYAGRYPGGVAPASQDPYGDPADEYQGQRVHPASEDPYGDPADEEEERYPTGGRRGGRW